MQRTHRPELPQQEIQDEKAAQQWLDSGIVVRRKTAEFSTGRQYGTLFSTRIIDAGEDWAVEFVIANANFRASVWEETVRAMLPAKHANRIIRLAVCRSFFPPDLSFIALPCSAMIRLLWSQTCLEYPQRFALIADDPGAGRMIVERFSRSFELPHGNYEVSDAVEEPCLV